MDFKKIFITTSIIIGSSTIICGAFYLQNILTELKNKEAELSYNQIFLDQSKINSEKLIKQNVILNNILSEEQRKSISLEEEKQQNEEKINKLTKLTTIDPELLKKYSKVYFLSENYTPPTLAIINPKYLIDPKSTSTILDKVNPFLENMLQDANNSGVPLRVTSSYRSFDTQKQLKSGYKMTYGAGTANKFSADQGYSEHQLGTTLDFTTPTVKNANPAFEKTTAFTWMVNNAYKYGFVLSYPKSNTYYEYEPWHWRFVGKPLATYLHEEGKYFYELDQRKIDGYLIKIFD